MIRALVMIAIAGFVLSIACIAAAVALGGPEAIARGGWNVAANHWGHGWAWDESWDDRHWHGDRGPTASRTLAWPGGESLDVGIPAEVRYTQAPGAGSVVVSGPQRLVEHVVVEGGHIRLDNGWSHRGRRLSITVQAPGVTDFDISGSGRLLIDGYKQPRLKLGVSGSGTVEARGEAEQVEVDISGSGDAELGELKTRDAQVDISGSGDATVAPTGSARLQISGSGDINLESHPAKLETDISGSGRVRQPAGQTESASPSPAPTGKRS